MKKIVVPVILLIFAFSTLFAQDKNARYGEYVSPHGTIRLLVVFADVVDDSNTNEVAGWNANELPRYKDSVIDYVTTGPFLSYASKFFNEASFGALNVIGDYYPTILNFYTSDVIRYGKNGIEVVAQRLNESASHDLETFHGYQLSDFDLWSLPENEDDLYMQKPNISNGKIDVLVVVWRHNSYYRTKRNGGSSGKGGPYTIKGMGIDQSIVVYTDDVSRCIVHEFSHKLLGGNEYHTGGAGAGRGHFLSNIGGYGILSSFNKNLFSCNAWDRWRLGWKPQNKQYYISALTPNGMYEIETNLVYGNYISTNEFILRDYMTTGDAIRIKLPYLKTINRYTENQYLWIENHQILPQTIEYNPSKPKGIRFNIQIGNDVLVQDFASSRTNYIVPLSYFGNYDFDYFYSPESVPRDSSQIDYFSAITYTNRNNPFSGYNLSMLPAIDYLSPYGIIQGNEHVNIYDVIFDGERILTGHPIFGNQYDAFPIGSTLSLSTNPPSTPLLTHNVKKRTNSDIPRIIKKDNRYIFLNGLKVDIVESYGDGSIKVRIIWDEFSIDRDVRWCDSIILNEKIFLKPQRKIIIDQGRTPVQSINPIIFNGEVIFADPTVFICKNESIFCQEQNSTVDVINNSTLVLESGSLYEVGDDAVLKINATGTLHIKSGATLRVIGTGHVEIQDGAYICIEDGANIELVDELSALNLRQGHQLGLNPVVFSQPCNCTSTQLNDYALSTGSTGQIHKFESDRYIQDTTYHGNAYETGNTIWAGRQITTQKPQGDVIIENGAHVIMDAENDVKLEPGVTVKLGAVLEVR